MKIGLLKDCRCHLALSMLQKSLANRVKEVGKGGADAEKEALKLKNELVIAISPDEEQSCKAREGSSKERGRTLTGILTARSKVPYKVSKLQYIYFSQQH